MEWLEAVQWNAARIKTYQKGQSGKNGKSDCIGLVIGALEHMGIKWDYAHGTNTAVRKAMRTFEPITSVSCLTAGEVVYKAFHKGDAKYALPSYFADDDDQTDYYHIGVVMSVNPLVIWHCSSGGMHEDTRLGNWTMHGWLKMLNEGRKEAMSIVVSGGNIDKPIRMRQKPSKSSEIVREIPQGAYVDYLGDSGEWAKVIFDGRTGYVLCEFIHEIDDGESDIVPDDIPAEIREMLNKVGGHLYSACAIFEQIYDYIGRG